jgi:hypothetical protein
MGEIRKLLQLAEIGIGDPGAAEIHAGDFAGRIANDGTAGVFDPSGITRGKLSRPNRGQKE